MSDDLRKAFDEMKKDLGAVKERLGTVEELQRETADRQRETANLQAKAADATADATRRFDTFLVRFNEVSEMLITHDTEQLQRVAAVERENDALKADFTEKWQDIARRVEALEKKAG